ncbi:MAG: metallophosphoesterase, partial [Clostridia bacterium]|nr:metallophosphoesterase [Clostridia bacterium]
ERQSEFKKGEVVKLFWGNEDGVFADRLPVAEKKVATTDTELDFSIEENIVIPNGATKLFAYEYRNGGENYLGGFDIPEVKRTNLTPIHIFASISDTHCNYPQGKAYLANALKEFIAAGVEYVINSGDIGESDSDYEKYVSAVEESGYQGLIFSCIGNHEQTVNGRANFFKYAIFDGIDKNWVSLDQAEEYFENEYKGTLDIRFDYAGDAEHKLYYYSVVIDNNAIIFMDQQLNSTGDTPNQDNFSVAELDFVEEFLEKYSGVHTVGGEFKYERYNLFIVEHSPVEQLKIGDKFNPGYGGAIKLNNSSFVNNLRFVNILKEYSEATWMSGHTHVQFDAGIMYIDKLYDSSGKLTDTPIAHAIHNSSLAQPRYYEGNSMIFYNDYHAASQGYICYQYSDRLVYDAHIFKPFTPDNGDYDENSFVDRIDAAHSYVIPLYTLDHTLPEPEEPSINYAVAENGIKRQGTFTFADTENGLQVDFSTADDRFEVKLGDQTEAYENGLWLSFYIDTEMTAINVGDANTTGPRKTDFTIDFSQSGSNYKLKTVNGKILIQMPISGLYHSDIITDL